MTTTKSNLPKLNCKFLDREDSINSLLSELGIESRTWLVVIWGTAGVGKTTLAQYTGQKIRSLKEYDAVVWTSCKEEFFLRGYIKKQIKKPILTNINGLFAEIARVLKIDLTRLSFSKKQEIIKEILKTKKVLVIIDNLESMDENDAQEVLYFLRKTLPAPSKAMITSRLLYTGQSEYTLKLDALQFEAIYNLIKNEFLSQNQDTEMILSIEEVHEIYRKTGGIPLAVKWIIGQFKAQKKKDLSRILERLDSSMGDEFLEYCFKQSYYQLRSDTQKILKCLAQNTQGLEVNQIGSITNLNEYKTSTGLETLQAMSLIEFVPDENKYSLLPLTRSFILKQIIEEQPDIN
jgi:hypothetical protein